jgi:hypothetical protein
MGGTSYQKVLRNLYIAALVGGAEKMSYTYRASQIFFHVGQWLVAGWATVGFRLCKVY